MKSLSDAASETRLFIFLAAAVGLSACRSLGSTCVLLPACMCVFIAVILKLREGKGSHSSLHNRWTAQVELTVQQTAAQRACGVSGVSSAGYKLQRVQRSSFYTHHHFSTHSSVLFSLPHSHLFPFSITSQTTCQT